MITKIALVLVSLASLASASTLAFATGGGRGHEFVLADSSTRVTAGSLVRLGYLSIAGNVDSFVEFGRTTMSDPSSSFTIGGFLTNPISNNDPAQNTAAQGKQAYIWVYNAPTAAGATQQGLFTSASSTWTIPATFTGGATESSNITLGVSAAPAFSQVTAVIGTFSTGGVTVGAGTNTAGSIYSLAAIPEPSAMMLGLLSLGLIARRKR